MDWVIQHKSWVGIAIAAALVIAIVGPWAYTRDGVPPAEWCQPPLILLESGSCVGRNSGAYFLLLSIIGFPAGILQIVSGELVLSELLRYAVFPLYFLGMFLLPVISTLLLLRRPSSLKRRTFYAIAWGLAAGLGMLQALTDEAIHPAHLWGIWLYILLALGLLAFGLIARQREGATQPG